jgi:hypothetical protein
MNVSPAIPFVCILHIGCAPSVAETVRSIDSAAWARGRSSYRELASSQAVGGRTERVRVKFDWPAVGLAMAARGAVAVRPPCALRMQLVGPGGVTALDVWMNDGRYRVEVPAASFVERGVSTGRCARATSTPPVALGPRFPVGFFQWWFLERFDGRLLWASDRALPDATRTRELFFAVKAAQSTAVVLARRQADARWALVAERAGEGRLESIEWHASAAGEGVRTFYRDRYRGLRVDIDREGTEDTNPDDEAFADPDGLGGAP